MMKLNFDLNLAYCKSFKTENVILIEGDQWRTLVDIDTHIAFTAIYLNQPLTIDLFSPLVPESIHEKGLSVMDQMRSELRSLKEEWAIIAGIGEHRKHLALSGISSLHVDETYGVPIEHLESAKKLLEEVHE